MICTICKKEFPDNDDLTQDQSIFVCDACQDKINLDAWKNELALVSKSQVKTPSQEVRLEWLKKKIEKVNSQ
jgi:hypothetical protein